MMSSRERRRWVAVGRVLWAAIIFTAAFIGGMVGSCAVRTP